MYVAAQDLVFLQSVLDILVDTFARVGLKTNIAKTQAMICMPRKICIQLSSESYRRMQMGRVTASEWEAHIATCRECGKQMQNSSLGHHLADVHDIYQQAVVAEELLEKRDSKTYITDMSYFGKSFNCSYPGCLGVLNSGWMMQCNFRDVQPRDLVCCNTKASTHDANDVGCNATRLTRHISTPKNATPGRNGGINGIWWSARHLPYVNSSPFTTECSSRSTSSNISGAFFLKTTMTFRWSALRFGKPAPPGRV